MKLEGRTRSELIRLFTGMDTTDNGIRKAALMTDMLIKDGVKDTNDLSYAKWCEYIQRAES